MSKRLIVLSIVLAVFASATCRKGNTASPAELSIAFYNIDNLYDIIDDTTHHDDEFTASGKYAWDTKRYHQKLDNLSKVIHELAGGRAPDILGVCELESAAALSDLLGTRALKAEGYRFVHYDSPDERGVDVALVYKNSKFKVLESKPLKVVFTLDPKDKTRDILWVKGVHSSAAKTDTLQFYICHFPSRREGKDESEPNRLDAAGTIVRHIKEVSDPGKDRIIIMGDFNDQPWDKSIRQVIGTSDFASGDYSGNVYNLMYGFRNQERGTYKFRGHMEILDQFMISRPLFDKTNPGLHTATVDIQDADWLQQKGKMAGYPLRTFAGNKWLNGYSDHFPIYMTLTYD